MPKIFDNPDDWFNGTAKRTRKSKGSAGGATPTSFRFSSSKARTNNTIKGIKSATGSRAGGKNLPQVVVKISGSSKGADKAQAHATYIGRNGKVELEDEDGRTYSGNEQKQLLKSWEMSGMHSKAETGIKREAFHFVFSMPAGTNPQAMKTAVKNLVQEEFAGHKYFMAQHLDTDSPHVHVLLCATDDRGARLNPRKQDLHNYRVAFVNKLAEQGIEATASRRHHRFLPKDIKKDGEHQKAKRLGDIPKKPPTKAQQEKIDKANAGVLSAYQSFEKQLPQSDIKTATKELIRHRQKKKDIER